MRKILTLILPSLAFLSLSGVSTPTVASDVTDGLHAVDHTVAHAIGARKCRYVRERHWSHRSHRWVWTSERVCHRL
jgi:hypothetical protein